MGEQTKKLLGNEDIEIAITPFGVDIKKFMRAGDISKNSDEINLGIIKTLSPKYGIEYLIKAFSILLSLYNGDKKLKLKIYGSGDLLEQLIDLTKELKIDRDVTFMGKIPNDEVPSALWGIDIFCLSSILDSESFGVSAVEAMAAGLPVVATDVSGFKEVMEDGTTGIIVPAKDPQAMAHAILRLIEDRQLRDLMGASGQERVTELYNWDNNVQNMIDLYNDLIK
jgi:glycosyltransferase involved in cell wall biosynthesis